MNVQDYEEGLTNGTVYLRTYRGMEEITGCRKFSDGTVVVFTKGDHVNAVNLGTKITSRAQ